MKSILFILGTIVSLSMSANTYNVIDGKPYLYSDKGIGEVSALKARKLPSIEPLEIRLKVKKYRITQTPSGPKLKFWDVCELDSKTDVLDLRGGGLIQEQIFTECKAEWMGKSVTVVLSGMVYDSNSSDFSDEVRELKRNFFSHLSVEGGIGFSIGDFNLDNTKTINFDHMVSVLSVDPRYSLAAPAKFREGFTASIRYRQ